MAESATHSEHSPSSSARFEQITEDLLAELARQDRLREEALTLSRRIVRSSAMATRAAHRGEFSEAAARLAESRQDIARLEEIAQACPLFSAIGYISDAQKEYAEACLTLAMLREEPLPRPEALQVPAAPYLNALGEAVGELRRAILDTLRQNSIASCETRLDMMQQIYDFLVTVDYPDALTGGLRRTTDAVRRTLENTRADLTTALRQRALQEALEHLEERLPRL